MIKIAKFCCKRRLKITELLLKKYKNNLENNLSYQSTNIKIKVIELLQNLCARNPKEVTILINKQLDVEAAFTMLVQNRH